MRSRRAAGSVAVAVVVTAALGLPGAANATFTVSYSPNSGLLVQGDGGSDAATVELQADGRYAVFVGTEPIFPIRIPGATLVAGSGCNQPEPRRVTCQVTGNRVITGSLGDASDMLEASGAGLGDMFVNGGPGADIVAGGSGFDAIDGGPGNDVLRGGAGNDLVEGGDGKDTITGDGTSGQDTLRGGADDDRFVARQSLASPDRIDGGPGIDSADYSNRTVGVSLLVTYGGARVADDGQAGEGDDIADDVEVLIGGEGPDTIAARHVAGTPAPSRLRIAGNGGSDRLATASDVAAEFDPGIGRDGVEGSSLSDRVLGRDGENDAVDCNGGIDTFVADLRDVPISPECEQVDQGAIDEGPNVVMRPRALRVARGGAVEVRLRCPRTLRIPCAGRLAVRLDRAGTRFGPVTRYSIRRGRTMTVTVQLPAAQRAGARRRGARLRLRSVERGSHGPKTTLRSLPSRRAPVR